MATANDGISRFSNSTVIGVPTFQNGITLPTTVPVAGQLGFTFFPVLTGSGGFTSAVPITYSSQLVPAGTYIITASGLASTNGAVQQAVIGKILAGATVVAFSQTGDSNNTLADFFVNAINVSATCKVSVPTTISFEIELIFSSGAASVNGSGFNFAITRIA